MSTVKLTLSAPPAVVAKAKKLARKNKTSVSAMFLNYINALARQEQGVDAILDELSPNTRRALGLAAHAPKGKPYRDTLAEALMEKYEIQE